MKIGSYATFTAASDALIEHGFKLDARPFEPITVPPGSGVIIYPWVHGDVKARIIRCGERWEIEYAA